MAKEKKRGFFSWLGLGRQDEEQTEQSQPVPEATQTAEQTADDATPAAVASAQNISETVAEQPVQDGVTAETAQTPLSDAQPLDSAVEASTAAPEQPGMTLAADTPDAGVEDEAVVDADAVDDTETPDDVQVEEPAEPEHDTVAAMAAPVVSQEQERPTKEGFFCPPQAQLDQDPSESWFRICRSVSR
ncbi:hypothetical protein OS21_31040 [Dickeya oryzae]